MLTADFNMNDDTEKPHLKTQVEAKKVYSMKKDET